jgi:hypothetical protein
MLFFRGKTVENKISCFFSMWKKRGKKAFFTVFPHMCGEKEKLSPFGRKLEFVDKA